jgi:archaellum component FlaC
VLRLKLRVKQAFANLPSAEISSEVEDLRSDIEKLKVHIASPASDLDQKKLSNQVKQLSADVSTLKQQSGASPESSAFARSLARLMTVERLPGDVTILKSQLQHEVSTEMSDVRRELNDVKGQISVNQKDLALLKLQIDGLAPKSIPSVPPFAPVGGIVGASEEVVQVAVPERALLDSVIVSGTPEIFAEFKGKTLALLWRGGRDGFKAKEFHKRCDGHANTLTVIKDTEGNVFGGFTTVAWEQKLDLKRKGGALKSFLFTLKNPHNLEARRFELKKERSPPIKYVPSSGPDFRDVGVASQSNTNRESVVDLGISYKNDTELDGRILFTGEPFFQVHEIEVFELTE